MIITATPEPQHSPPRVRLDFDSEGGEFPDLPVSRDGRPIRQQPATMGLTQTRTYDYEASFGAPVTYTATGSTATWWSVVHTETWSMLGGWSPITPPTFSGGRLTAGTLWRTVPTQGAFRITFADETAIGVGGRMGTIGAAVQRVSGTSGLSLTATDGRATTDTKLAGSPGQPVVLQFSADGRSVRLSQGSSSVVRPLGGYDTSTLVANAPLGGFAVETPPSPLRFSATTSATLDVPEAWLVHPSQPSLSMPIENLSDPHALDIGVEASTDAERQYAARQSVFQPNGRREAVVFPLGPRSAGAWTLVLGVDTTAERDKLLTLLDDQAPILLRSPASADWDLPDGWYAVGDLSVSRPIDIGSVQKRQITMPLTRVSEPPVMLAPSLTWGDLMLRGMTWGDLMQHTWLDLLVGEI